MIQLFLIFLFFAGIILSVFGPMVAIRIRPRPSKAADSVGKNRGNENSLIGTDWSDQRFLDKQLPIEKKTIVRFNSRAGNKRSAVVLNSRLNGWGLEYVLQRRGHPKAASFLRDQDGVFLRPTVR